MKFGIGHSVKRLEDDRLLKGHGRFTDDIHIDGELVGYVVRSPFAHATFGDIDTSDAMDVEGVHAVYTYGDIKDDLKPLPCIAPLQGRDGKKVTAPPRNALADGVARYVGDPIAFVVADNLNAAKDAAELLDIDYDVLDAVVNVRHAMDDGAPQVWADAPRNLSLDWEAGDSAGVDEAIKAAPHVVTLEVVNNRVVSNPIEPRAAVAEYDTTNDAYTIQMCSQGVWGLRDQLAGAVLGIDPEKLHVITPDVGGGFGTKSFLYHEYPLVLFAAKKLNRPVRWCADRGETFLSDAHGRDLVSSLTMALDDEGRFLAYKVETVANFGAYLSTAAPFITTMAPLQVVGGVYTIPKIHVHVESVLTHTVPVDAYRGAGRPEAAYMLERMVNAAAAHMGISQDEIRRRNFIQPTQIPFTTALGTIFDSGNFPKNLADAMKNADWDTFDARKAEAKSRGKLRGLGIGCYIECTLGAPSEDVQLRFTSAGRVELYVGTQSNGQGHLTTFSQIVSDRLGIDLEDIDLIEGDSARKSAGGGTGGSRSLQMIGPATSAACENAVSVGKELAADTLDAAMDEISFEDGLFQVKGTNRSVRITDMAREKGGFEANGHYTKEFSTFPNGCHIAEVEVDKATGTVDIVNYTVVDDFGVVINPMIVAGQVHGGVMQGVGQILTETCYYDDETGQLITGSFMDYGMPRADDISMINFQLNEVPCQTNPLGVKGCGEAGTIGALPATANAVHDALKDMGVDNMHAPITPLKVWQALNAAQ